MQSNWLAVDGIGMHSSPCAIPGGKIVYFKWTPIEFNLNIDLELFRIVSIQSRLGPCLKVRKIHGKSLHKIYQNFLENKLLPLSFETE